MRWHDKDCTEADRASCIQSEYDRINRATSQRQRRVLLAYLTYENLDSSWGLNSPIALEVRKSMTTAAPIVYNELANAVDSIAAELCQSLSRPTCVMVGGTFEDSSKAADVTGWLDWHYQTRGIDRITPQWVTDGILAGLGALRVFGDDGEPRAERIWPPHLLIDDASCVDVMPRDFYVRVFLDKGTAVEKWPEHKDAIESATIHDDDLQWLEHSTTGETRDQIRVIEAYRAPCGDMPGRYCCILDDSTILDEFELDDHTGLVFIRPIGAPRGFWPRSMADRAIPIQAELNKYLDRRAKSMHLHARPLIFLPRKAGIKKTYFDNKLGSILEYSGPQPPTYYTPPSMPPDVHQAIQEYSSKIYDAMGANEMSASSQVPRNLESGEAIANYVEMGSRRLVNIKREVDFARVELAETLTAVMRRIAEDNPKAEVQFERWGTAVTIPWREIAIPDKSMRWRILPTGALGATEAIKMERLEKWVEKGWLPMEDFIDATDAHDVKAIGDHMTAPIAVVRRMLERMMATGKYTPPAEYMPLERALGVAVRMLCQAQLAGASEDRMKLLRTWWEHAKEMLALAQPPAPPPGPPMPPPGMPLPPEMMPPPGMGPEMMGGPPPMPGGPVPPAMPMMPPPGVAA